VVIDFLRPKIAVASAHGIKVFDMKSSSGHKLGRRAEWAALLLLMAKGYRPLHRNWRGAGGELDLVMRRGDETVFVEVKARSGDLFGGAAAALNAKKQKVLTRTASAYLSRFGLWDRPCRYDLITLDRTGGILPWRIRHYQNVFQPNLGRQF
jgi:putative endonuclease